MIWYIWNYHFKPLFLRELSLSDLMIEDLTDINLNSANHQGSVIDLQNFISEP